MLPVWRDQLAAVRILPGEPNCAQFAFCSPGLIHMLLTYLLFFASAGLIYVACEYFVNAIEWAGRRLKLSDSATGTVLAAIGTALPECSVTFTAAALGTTSQQRDIAVGSAMGGPLVLATLAYAVVGLVLWQTCRRSRSSDDCLRNDSSLLARDQGWFMAVFAAKVALGWLMFPGKPWLAWVFVALYGLYVRKSMAGTHAVRAGEDDLEPLKIRPRQATPAGGWIALQLIVSMAVIGAASRVFVTQLEGIGEVMGVAPHIVALLFAPVATELPEILNALIWVRQGKSQLALSNISGAMMIQATIPSAIGIWFTPWVFDAPLTVAGLVTMLAIALLWWQFRWGRIRARSLAMIGLLYVVFALYVWLHFLR